MQVLVNSGYIVTLLFGQRFVALNFLWTFFIANTFHTSSQNTFNGGLSLWYTLNAS